MSYWSGRTETSATTRPHRPTPNDSDTLAPTCQRPVVAMATTNADKSASQQLRQALALQPLAGHLSRILMFAVNLFIELHQIIGGQRRLNGIQRRHRSRIVSHVRANQRYHVLRKDHRLRILQLDVTLLGEHRIGGEEGRDLNLVAVEVTDLGRVLRVRPEGFELGAVDLFQPWRSVRPLLQLWRSTKGGGARDLLQILERVNPVLRRKVFGDDVDILIDSW